MYFFVPYHLSGIQKGIQAGHCALEYAKHHGNTETFKDFMENDKTWIILNGGTTRDCDGISATHGEMNEIYRILFTNSHDFASFREPDLNNALTAICFIADERVWDFEKYPDEPDTTIRYNRLYKTCTIIYKDKTRVMLRELIRDKSLA